MNEFLLHQIRRALLIMLVALVCVFVIEGAYFITIMARHNHDAKTDAIIVFMGSNARIKAGYALANQGLAPMIILSPASGAFRDYCDKKYGLRTDVRHIAEEKAVSTMENTLYVSELIKAHHLSSVTLVTSNYHMPRSLALLRGFLIGENVRISIHQVRGFGQASDAPDGYSAALLKLGYNEMVKFWGSLAEVFIHKATSPPALKQAKKSRFFRFLKSLVLLEVKPWW